MTVAYPAELLRVAASVEDCGHVARKRFVDGGGRERCLECERDRKRAYETRREPRVRRRDVDPGVVVNRAALEVAVPRAALERVHLRVVEDELPELPWTREGCAGVPRPCPFVSCRYSLYLDVTPKGGLKLNFPELEPGDMPADASCALDVAERGGLWEEQVAATLNVNRRWVQKIEARALAKLQGGAAAALREHLEE